MPSLGEAWIEVHADTSPFDRELLAAVEAATIKAEAAMRARGRDAGNAYADGIERAVKDRAGKIGESFGKSLVNSAEKSAAEVKNVFEKALKGVGEAIVPDLDDTKVRRKGSALLNWVEGLAGNVRKAFSTTFSQISDSIASALSGIRPSLGLIAGAYIALGSVVAGAFVGLTPILLPIVALIGSLPALLTGLGVTVLLVTGLFSNLGTAIKAAFNATNAKELAKALEGLKGPTRDFVASFYSLGELWRELSKIFKDRFLQAFTEDFAIFVAALRDSGITKTVGQLGGAFGDLANAFLKFSSSKEGVAFLNDSLKIMTGFIKDATKALKPFLDAIARITKAAKPFLDGIGDTLTNLAIKFDNWIKEMEKSGDLDKFFKDALDVFNQLNDILQTLGPIFASFIRAAMQPSTEGGETLLDTLLRALTDLAEYLNSPEGQEGLKSLIELAQGATIAIVALTIAFVSLAAKFRDFTTWLFNTSQSVVGWVKDTWNGFWDAFERGFDGGWEAVQTFGTNVKNWAQGLANTVSSWANNIKTSITNRWNEVVAFFSGVPGRIKNALGDLGGLLYSAGIRLINGLIQGIKDAARNLKDTLSWITSLIPNWKGPEEVDRKLLQPAGQALMWGLSRGIRQGAQAVLGDLAALTGQISATANTNSFIFGPGAIQQNFAGTPSTSTARSMGTAVGASIAGAVNQQNTRAQTRAI